MIWNSAGEFFHMGGYGLYVWGSFLMVAAFMVVEAILVRMRRRRALEQLARARDLESIGEPDGDLEGGRS